MATVRTMERQLAVMTCWGLAGPFALGFILTGFNDDSIAAGLMGFGVVVAGLVAHVIVGQMYRTGFMSGEIVLGFVVFGVALLSFLAAWIVDRHFSEADIIIGLAGFAAIIAVFIAYVVIKFGLRGAFSMFHDLRHR
jgi:hypothetical protein